MIHALNMQIDRSRERVDPREDSAQPTGRASAALRLFAAGFALSPLVIYLAAFTPQAHRLVDAGAGLLFTLALVALPALLAFRGWTTALFYLALNLLATASLVNLALTGELPSLGAAAVALRTDWNEASAMLSAASQSTLAIGVATLAWLVGCVAFLPRAPRLPARFASRPARALLAAPLLLAFVVPAGTTYPVSLVTIAHGLRDYNAESRRFQRRLVDPYQVTRAAPGEQVVVLVIGESSGAKHWQLNGYARPTTPNMVRRQQAGELASFQAHMSTAGMTTYAVPSLLSPFEEINGLHSPPHRRSLVTLMSRAGFRTAWFGANTRQAAETEADEIVHASDDSMLEVDVNYDRWLPRYMGLWLDRVDSGSAFAVLHTWGSHTPFEVRYPREAAVWKDHVGKIYPHSQTVDNYDNSILHTDAVLETAIRRLEQERRPALLVYVADHAEPWMKRSFWRYQAPRDANLLHVPLFFWANAAWRQAHPAQWNRLQAFARSGQVTTHQNLVPTLAAALGIGYEGMPRHRDALSPAFRPWTDTTPALGSDDKTIVQAVPPRPAPAAPH